MNARMSDRSRSASAWNCTPMPGGADSTSFASRSQRTTPRVRSSGPAGSEKRSSISLPTGGRLCVATKRPPSEMSEVTPLNVVESLSKPTPRQTGTRRVRRCCPRDPRLAMVSDPD
jgi:hypothetical protein